MDAIKIKNETGLELTVTTEEKENELSIMGGMDTAPTWDEYLSGYKDEYMPHFLLIKEAIEKLGWVGEKAESKANKWHFVYSDGVSISFTWRAWGDLMSAIVGKNEGYMTYYM